MSLHHAITAACLSDAELSFRNKFRALMKRFEAEGSSWAQPSAGESTAIEKPTTKRARPAAKKKNATSEPEPESGEDEAEEAERPKKKAATNGTKAKVGAKKGVAKKMTAAKSGETIEEDADDQEEAE